VEAAMPQGSLPFRMFVLCVAITCATLLAACVSAPPPTPQFAPAFPPKGLPLASPDTIAFMVSSDVPPPGTDDPATVEISPISHKASVIQGFEKGFLAVLPNTHLVEADAALREACFDVGTKSVTPRGVVLTIPNPKEARCRALVEARRIAYLVIIGGQRKTTTANTSSAQIATQTLDLGGAVSLTHDHDFQLVAYVIGGSSSSSDCDEGSSQWAQSKQSVGFVLSLYLIPIPYVKVIDESSYWTDVGIRLGQKIAWCFVSPNSEAAAVTAPKPAGEYDDDWR
jgi:hypothetical protein